MRLFARSVHLGRQQLSVAQTARALALDVRTVSKWAIVQQFQARTGKVREGKLDAYKGQIRMRGLEKNSVKPAPMLEVRITVHPSLACFAHT